LACPGGIEGLVLAGDAPSLFAISHTQAVAVFIVIVRGRSQGTLVHLLESALIVVIRREAELECMFDAKRDAIGVDLRVGGDLVLVIEVHHLAFRDAPPRDAGDDDVVAHGHDRVIDVGNVDARQPVVVSDDRPENDVPLAQHDRHDAAQRVGLIADHPTPRRACGARLVITHTQRR
jgi:hypothetical protein